MAMKVDLKPLNDLRIQLSNMFVGRDFEVNALIASLISGEPMILVGAPGTAKTMMVEVLSRFVNARYFYYLLTRFTEPDELLGTLDINALREGRYVRITSNRLPEADIVFLDEIFKASSAIRNILLDIILNKRYLNGTEYKKIPALTFYCASNEVSTDAEDMAFYDRLTIRSFVKSVGMDLWRDLIVKGVELLDVKDRIKPIIDVEYVRQLQNAVILRTKSIVSDRAIIDKYLEVLSRLRDKGIEISDRRKIKVLVVFSAISIIYAEEEPSPDSLAEALRITAVHNEDDIHKVEDVINECKLSRFYDHIQRLIALETEISKALNDIKSKPIKDITPADYEMLEKLFNTAVEILKKTPKDTRFIKYISSIRAKLAECKALLSVARGSK